MLPYAGLSAYVRLSKINSNHLAYFPQISLYSQFTPVTENAPLCGIIRLCTPFLCELIMITDSEIKSAMVSAKTDELCHAAYAIFLA